MSFFGKVVAQVLNGLLVEGLAKSPSFQRFAIYTNGMYKEGVKSAEPLMKDNMQKVQDFTKAFRENLSKEAQQVLKDTRKEIKNHPPPPR